MLQNLEAATTRLLKLPDGCANGLFEASRTECLNPVCGNGIFLIAALEQFVDLGGISPGKVSTNLTGVELNPEEADVARRRLCERFGQDAEKVVQTGDFFEAWQQLGAQTFDAVVGNPPFIRYQNFPEQFRDRAMDIMRRARSQTESPHKRLGYLSWLPLRPASEWGDDWR